MVNKKPIRTRGKISFSRCFQNLKNGDCVTIVKEKAVASAFPKRLQGRTGIIQEKKGKSYIVKIKENSTEKKFIIAPIHLKKIKQIKE